MDHAVASIPSPEPFYILLPPQQFSVLPGFQLSFQLSLCHLLTIIPLLIPCGIVDNQYISVSICLWLEARACKNRFSRQRVK